MLSHMLFPTRMLPLGRLAGARRAEDHAFQVAPHPAPFLEDQADGIVAVRVGLLAASIRSLDGRSRLTVGHAKWNG